MAEREHSYLPTLKRNFADGRIDRREFLRTSTLLGLSAGAAYALAGKVTGEPFTRPARAAMPMGGTLRIGMPVGEREIDRSQMKVSDEIADLVFYAGGGER